MRFSRRRLSDAEKRDRDDRQRGEVAKFAIVTIAIGVPIWVIGVDIGALLVAIGCTCFAAIFFWFAPTESPEGEIELRKESSERRKSRAVEKAVWAGAMVALAGVVLVLLEARGIGEPLIVVGLAVAALVGFYCDAGPGD